MARRQKKFTLSHYFRGIAVKRLALVEVDPGASNQHEFDGVSSLREILGDERRDSMPAHFIYMADDPEETIIETAPLTWYDARERHPKRSEYRLYYKSNAVMDAAAPGDVLVVAVTPDDQIWLLVARAESLAEQLMVNALPLTLFENGFDVARFGGEADPATGPLFRQLLDEIGIEVDDGAEDYLDLILKRFGAAYPTTRIFSEFARETLPEALSIAEDPDYALMAWLEHEELLFRTLERHIVEDRLKSGFEGVDDFVAFSLSVQNRRKSRTGHALENHLDCIFRTLGLRYERNAITENRSKPDFLFPGEKEYHDKDYSGPLFMLGVKSTCKDRWRQVLSEAARIPEKHLLTLQPGISAHQTDEMRANNLRLVIPQGLQGTYQPEQRKWLIDVKEFAQSIGLS